MKYLLTILLALFALSAHAVDPEASGLWYTPDRDGEGISVHVLEGVTVAHLYTYGSNGKAWYVMTGDGDMTVYGTILNSADPFDADVFEVGTAYIELLGPDTLEFRYSLELDVDRDAAIPWCLGPHCEGSHTYQRIK